MNPILDVLGVGDFVCLWRGERRFLTGIIENEEDLKILRVQIAKGYDRIEIVSGKVIEEEKEVIHYVPTTET